VIAPGTSEAIAAARGLVWPGGPLYRDAHYLMAEVELDADRAAPWVPFPLRLDRPARATLFTAHFPWTAFGSVYCEAGLLLHVRLGPVRGVFCPWMIVDDDTALIAGRELLGYPKKLGQVAFERSGDSIVSEASRRGERLLTLNAKLGERIEAPPPAIGQLHFNVRSALGVSVPKLIAFRPAERPIEVREATASLRCDPARRDPLSTLGLGDVLSARLHRVDLTGGWPPVPLCPVSPRWFASNLLVRVH